MTPRTRQVFDLEGKLVGWFVACPACEASNAGMGHIFWLRMGNGAPGWEFDGNVERPTFSPSMRARCDLGEEHREHVCHSFVRDGKIEYLGDCTHAMAGQTIELPEVEP